jgi:hypothetical protein
MTRHTRLAARIRRSPARMLRRTRNRQARAETWLMARRLMGEGHAWPDAAATARAYARGRAAR